MCTSCPVLTTWREVDEVAERIRALGEPAPGNYKAFSSLTSIEEEEGVPSAEDMIRQLVGGQEAVVRTARSIFPAVEKAHDEPTDRKSVVEGKSVSVRVDLGGRRIIKKKSVCVVC